MTNPKLTKHEDDILRNIRQPDRYDPKARSIGGPWRMVKCKEGAYVCYEQHLEIIDNLRKNAEINPAQSSHDGIHTCSKGCSKPGCKRGLRDIIEEQNAQIVALKRDLLEKSAELRKKAQDTVHDLNLIASLKEDNADLLAKYHEAHDERADYAKDVSKLKSEVERLTTTMEKVITASDVIDGRNQQLIAEVERLRKAGNAMASNIPRMVTCRVDANEVTELMDAWNAAKEGKPQS